jgi:hypothetical protein
VIPGGALSEETIIVIEENPSGYPEIPSSIEAQGSVFAFLPHDLVFASPVTVTVPFTGSATDGLQLFTASEGGSWVAVADAAIQGNAMQARVGHFSYFLPGRGGSDTVTCACQGRPDTDGSFTCVEIIELVENAEMCTMLESQCSDSGNTFLDHCPSGFTGRCTHGPEANGEVKMDSIYNAIDTSGFVKAACEAGGGVWEG